MHLTQFQTQIKQELTQNILPFYMGCAVDHEHGGFYGRIDNDNTPHPHAPKGQIQHSRLLWTFAQAYRVLARPDYGQMAEDAYTYLHNHFWDAEAGGFYALVDFRGRPLQTDKVIYGQAFGIYGLTEYYLATGIETARKTAVSLYKLLEKQATDNQYGGYFEAFSADWQQRLAYNIDQTAPATVKTMNTHLHLLEAYTNLLRAWSHDEVRHSLYQLIRLHIDQILNPASGHLYRHFAADWTPLHEDISYGHDIEASWLLVEAADALGDPELLAEVTAVSLHMAQVIYQEGIDVDGGLRDKPGTAVKEWWPQAEALVGFINAYQLGHETIYLDTAVRLWHYIQDQLVDHTHGDWFWGRLADGTLLPKEKAGLWKTPYHNSRACLELGHRLQSLIKIAKEQ